MKRMGVFVAVIVGLFLFSHSSNAANTSESLWISCSDSGFSTDRQSRYVWTYGQGYLVQWDVAQNDDPSPFVEICVYGGDCMTAQGPGWDNMPSLDNWPLGPAPENTFFGIQVTVECDGGISNPNEFQGSFAIYGRYTENHGIAAADSTVVAGNSVTIYFNASNAGEMYLDISGGYGRIDLGGNISGYSAQTYDFTPSSEGTYSIQGCTYGPSIAGGGRWSTVCDTISITATPAPPGDPAVNMRCNITDGPCILDQSTESVFLDWPTNSYTTECNASGDWSGSKAAGGGTEWQSLNQGDTKVFTLTCKNSIGTEVSDSVTVYRQRSDPSVSIQCNGTSGPCSVQLGAAATLSWSSDNADQCYASGAWSGTKDLAGSESSGAINVNSTFYINCRNSDTGWVSASVQVNPTLNNPPVVSSASATQPNYCSSGPLVTVAWTYTDPDGNPQGWWQVQIDDDAAFGSPAYDSGKQAGAINSALSSALSFNTTYRARVKVWDSTDTASAWKAATPATWTMPPHAYPSSMNFTWTPTNPVAKQETTFSKDTTTCYAVGGAPAACTSYTWNFGDGTAPVTTSAPTQKHTYSVTGNYTVQMTAQDAQGFACSVSKTVGAQGHIPSWKEVLP